MNIPEGFASIDFLKENTNEVSYTDLETIANSDEYEEVPSNVLRAFNILLSRGQTITKNVADKLIFLAEKRMDHLKPKFSGKSVGREADGKMEYDTILEEIRKFKNNI